MTLEATVSKEDLIEEHHMRSRLIDLVFAQLVHQGKLLVALESEVKLTVRDLFLYSSLRPGSNKILLSALQNSRISVPELFGPIPETHKYKIDHQEKFDPLSPPGSFSISGPLLKKRTFLLDPLATEGQTPLQGNPQGSVLYSGNPGVFGVQKTPGEVAESRQPRYPSLPPEEQLPEAEGVPEVEDQPAEQGRGVRQRFGWFRSGGPSVLPHPGHS